METKNYANSNRKHLNLQRSVFSYVLKDMVLEFYSFVIWQ